MKPKYDYNISIWSYVVTRISGLSEDKGPPKVIDVAQSESILCKYIDCCGDSSRPRHKVSLTGHETARCLSTAGNDSALLCNY